MAYQHILYDTEAGVARITLNHYTPPVQQFLADLKEKGIKGVRD